jgi:hypothetical protein
MITNLLGVVCISLTGMALGCYKAYKIVRFYAQVFKFAMCF